MTPNVNRKVGVGAFAGGISVIVVWLAQQFGAVIPAEVASAITTVLSFLASYFVKEGE